MKLQKISYTVPKFREFCRINAENAGISNLSHVNARYDYSVSCIRWLSKAIANETIEMKSLVSRCPIDFKLAMGSRRAALSGNISLIVIFF